MRTASYALIAAALGLGACTSSDLTFGDACRGLVPSLCEYRIRCEEWAGTQADCENVASFECCDGRDCSAPVTVDRELLDTCAASIRGAVCEGGGPAVSSACASAIEPVSVDAGTMTVDASSDAGGTDAGQDHGLYGTCSTDADCGGESEGCIGLVHATTEEVCTRRCSDPEDLSCPDGHCVRVRAMVGGVLMDAYPVCLQACTQASDCPSLGLDCITTQTGFQVCHPPTE